MTDINAMIQKEIENGFGDANAQAKVCQDLILKAIAASSLNRNVTIKGGVVMRSKTGNTRRATQDVDLDFIKYSMSDGSIEDFVRRLDCLDGLKIERTGRITELKHQDYHGKRIFIRITDTNGFAIESKVDIGVHKKLDIEQEEYCFDIAYDDQGASLLVNSYEQMIAEKLRSLLKFGTLSSRYKDIFDIYYISKMVDRDMMGKCLSAFIFDDPGMRENNMDGILRRINIVFSDKAYIENLKKKDNNWLDEDINTVTNGILIFLKEYR